MKVRIAIITVLVILCLDQILKLYIKTHFKIGDEIDITSWFKLHFIENEGMAFGLMLGKSGSWGKVALSVFRIVAVGFIIYIIRNLIKQNASIGLVVCTSMILAGAIGNILDSLFYGILFNESTPFSIAHFLPKEGGYAAMLHGKVVDMLYFPLYQGVYPQWVPKWGGQYFEFFEPVFNIADASISCGVIIILFFQKSFFKSIDPHQHVAAPEVETTNNDASVTIASSN